MAHTPFWPTGQWSAATGERIGPAWDGFVGQEGKYEDLYEAYATEGWRRIILSYGAILGTNLTITADDVVIWSPFALNALDLGAKWISVTGKRCHLAGFKLNGGTGTGIVVQSGGSAHLERVGVDGFSAHGVQYDTTENDCTIDRCDFRNNGGDGLRLTDGDYLRVLNSLIWNNTAYGVNDQINASILVGNRIASNTSGQINGTPAVDSGNQKT